MKGRLYIALGGLLGAVTLGKKRRVKISSDSTFKTSLVKHIHHRGQPTTSRIRTQDLSNRYGAEAFRKKAYPLSYALLVYFHLQIPCFKYLLRVCLNRVQSSTVLCIQSILGYPAPILLRTLVDNSDLWKVNIGGGWKEHRIGRWSSNSWWYVFLGCLVGIMKVFLAKSALYIVVFRRLKFIAREDCDRSQRIVLRPYRVVKECFIKFYRLNELYLDSMTS